MTGYVASGQTTKLAWIRNPDVPAGQPAPGRFDCTCGTSKRDVPFCGPAWTCEACGQTWDGRGWLISQPTTTELAALIAASPRFLNGDARYFDELARVYGGDHAGLAFTQACLKADQDAGREVFK